MFLLCASKSGHSLANFRCALKCFNTCDEIWLIILFLVSFNWHWVFLVMHIQEIFIFFTFQSILIICWELYCKSIIFTVSGTHCCFLKWKCQVENYYQIWASFFFLTLGNNAWRDQLGYFFVYLYFQYFGFLVLGDFFAEIFLSPLFQLG